MLHGHLGDCSFLGYLIVPDLCGAVFDHVCAMYIADVNPIDQIELVCRGYNLHSVKAEEFNYD